MLKGTKIVPSALSPRTNKRSVPGGKEPVPQETEAAEDLKDNEGRPIDRDRIVVNFANVGATYGERVLKRNSNKFSYDGVRLCVKHLAQKLGLKVIGVVFENYRAVNDTGLEVWKVPKDIENMCESIELTPRVTGQQHKSADDEMTIKLAYRRNCRFLDNDNYRDWVSSMADESVRAWLEECQDTLQMRYFFDSGLGEFDTLDGNLPTKRLVKKPRVS